MKLTNQEWKDDPRKAIFIAQLKKYTGPEYDKHRDLMYSNIAKLMLITHVLFDILQKCKLSWVEEKPCDWENGRPCLKILLAKAKAEGVENLPTEENVCFCRIDNFSAIRKFDFPEETERCWVHFTEVAIADWFKNSPSIIGGNVPRMYLQGAFEEKFLVNIYDYKDTKSRCEEMKHNKNVTGNSRVVDPKNRYKSKNSSPINTGYVPRKAENTPVDDASALIESSYDDIDINYYQDDSGIGSFPPSSTPMEEFIVLSKGKVNGQCKNITIAEQHYLDLGHSLIDNKKAMKGDLFNVINVQFFKQNIVDPNTLNDDLLSTFAYVDKSMRDHFDEWSLNKRFQPTVQPEAWIKLVSGFVNICKELNVYECHVAMIGFREFVFQCETEEKLPRERLFLC